MAKVRRKVLMQFTRNTRDGIVVGHPEHPEENGRFVVIEEDIANMLADEGLIGDEDTLEKMPEPGDEGESESTRQRRGGDTIADLVKEGQGKGVGGGDTGGGEGNVDGANGAVGGVTRNSAQAVRENQVAGKPTPADQKQTGRGQRGGRTPKTKAPAGGDQTAATTSHPAESGPNTPPSEIPGNGSPSESDPDAAPTGGGAAS